MHYHNFILFKQSYFVSFQTTNNKQRTTRMHALTKRNEYKTKAVASSARHTQEKTTTPNAASNKWQWRKTTNIIRSMWYWKRKHIANLFESVSFVFTCAIYDHFEASICVWSWAAIVVTVTVTAVTIECAYAMLCSVCRVFWPPLMVWSNKKITQSSSHCLSI